MVRKVSLISLTLLAGWLILSLTPAIGQADYRYQDRPFYDPYDADTWHTSDPFEDEAVAMFYEALAPHGDWIWLPRRGWVWRPFDVPPDWRPYTDGRWVWTDDGWTWVSDWDWGWAPFHYGRWFPYNDYGWLWVPGTEWAPAWVDWRHGDGWIGWAPLPPHIPLRRDGMRLVILETERYIPVTSYSFVQERRLLEPRVVRYITPARRNHTLIPVTRNVTNYVIVNKKIVDRSIDVKYIERVVRKPLRRYRVVEKPSHREARGDRLRGDEVIIIRPKPKHVARRLERPLKQYGDHADKRDEDIRRPRLSPEPKGHIRGNIQEHRPSRPRDMEEAGDSAPRPRYRERHPLEAASRAKEPRHPTYAAPTLQNRGIGVRRERGPEPVPHVSKPLRTHPMERRPEQRGVSKPSGAHRYQATSDPVSASLKRMEGNPNGAAAPIGREQRHPLADSGRTAQRDRERRQGAKRATPVREVGPGAPSQITPATVETLARDVRQRHLDRRAAAKRGDEPQQAATPGYTQAQRRGERRLKHGHRGDFRDLDG